MATAFLDQDIGRGGSPLSRCQSADCVATKKSFMTATSNGTIKQSKGATKMEKVVQPTVNDTFRGVNLSAIPMLPESINLAYLAEGAANIIYRFSLPRGFSEPDGVLKFGVDKTHLLRLRKALPSGSPNLPAFAALQKVFFPLFPTEFILDTQIVRIPEGLIERANALLKQREQSGHRIEKRTGLYLVGPPPPPGTPIDENGEKSTQYERYAFLVEDMTPASPTTNSEHGKIRREVLVEFKPKWLAQSSSAPSGSRRCRTCALRIAKEFKKHGTVIPGNGSGNPGHWCPFDLASGDAHRVRLAVRGMLSRKGAVLTGWKKPTGAKGEVDAYEAIILEDKLVRYFTNSKGKELLDLLKNFQTTWDPRGPVSIFGENGDQNTEPKAVEDGRDGEWGDEWTKDVKHFLMAMTIRDLTLFLKVDLTTPFPSDLGAMDGSVQARIGDLDLKSPENGKAKYWIDAEKKLREGGWYAGTEQKSKVNSHRPPVIRKASSVGDKRKHAEVEGEIADGRKFGSSGEPVEVLVERERDEEGFGGEAVNGEIKAEDVGNVRWCIF